MGKAYVRSQSRPEKRPLRRVKAKRLTMTGSGSSPRGLLYSHVFFSEDVAQFAAQTAVRRAAMLQTDLLGFLSSRLSFFDRLKCRQQNYENSSIFPTVRSGTAGTWLRKRNAKLKKPASSRLDRERRMTSRLKSILKIEENTLRWFSVRHA